MKKNIKKQFDIGFINENIEIINKHDWTDKINPFDCTYFYDIIDHNTGKKYAWLTYKEVERVLNGKCASKKIIFFLTQKMIDEMINKSNFYNKNNNLSYLTDIDDYYSYPSELENSLIDLIINNKEFDNLEFINDKDVWDFAVGTLNNILIADDIDDEYRKYREECIKNNIPLNGKISSDYKFKKYQIGDIIIGKFNILQIIKKHSKDKFNRSVFDVKELITGNIYHKVNTRDIRRMARNDFPIISINGVAHTFKEWSMILKLHPNSLRNYYRNHNNSIEEITKRIEVLLKEKNINIFD